MAIINIINKSKLEGALRIEAEYYTPEQIQVVEQLHTLKAKPLSVFCSSVRKGIFDLPPSNYVDIGVPLIRTTEIKKPIADLSSVARIPLEVHQKHSSTELNAGDIVFTKIGANIGDVAILPEEETNYNFSQNVAGAKIIKSKIESRYLACFLSTRFGRTQIKRIQMLSGQGKLELIDIKRVLIFIAPDEIRRRIDELYSAAEAEIYKSKEKYQQAERELLQRLGLLNRNLPHALTFKRQYGDVTKARRCDAEYFQPKYDSLLTIIANKADYSRSIRSIAKFNSRGLQPKYTEKGSLKVINSKHILEKNLDYEGFERADESSWDLQKEARVFRDDILTYTTGANVGRTNIYLDEERALASNHVNILRIRDENPIYVSFVMNSIVGRLQVRKLVTGTAQAELYPSDIDKMVIPFLNIDVQNEIVKLVIQSNDALILSRQLFDKAKRAVEIAIEEGEDRARQYLERG